MKNVIRRAAFVDANALLKDECSASSRLTVVGEEMADSPQNLHDDAE